jgi:hypothetical protein
LLFHRLTDRSHSQRWLKEKVPSHHSPAVILAWPGPERFQKPLAIRVVFENRFATVAPIPHAGPP